MYSVDIYSRVRRACLKDGMSRLGSGVLQGAFRPNGIFWLNMGLTINLSFGRLRHSPLVTLQTWPRLNCALRHRLITLFCKPCAPRQLWKLNAASAILAIQGPRKSRLRVSLKRTCEFDR